MNPRRVRKRRFVAEINVVPYIDVMLVLLVIFMITTPLLTQGVKIQLPKAQAQALAKKQKEPIVVSVDEKGQFYLNLASKPNQPLSSQALTHLVKEQIQFRQQMGASQQVMVRGDRAVDYGKVMQAMVLLQKAGASNIGLITQAPADKKVS
jgi:biopolymer transport protein TolR